MASTSSNLTKAELRLVNQSLPNEIKKISPRQIRQARTRTEGLVKKYRTSMRGEDDKKRLRMMQYRINHLEKALKRYSKNVDSTKIEKRKASLSRAKGKLTRAGNGSVGQVRKKASSAGSRSRRLTAKNSSRRGAMHDRARNQRIQARRDYRH